MAKSYVADGALFKDAPLNDGKVHPIMHIALTVCGVKLNLAVWEKAVGKSGTVYWPVTGDYARNETRRLVDVTPVFGSAAAPEGQTSAPTPGEGNSPSGSDDLPF